MADVNFNVTELFANPREIYGAEINTMGAKHENIVVATADVTASNKFAQFRDSFPTRFFNVGIAEANLMGVGAGLALDGKVPFVSTFAAFASMRAHEQVRTDIAYPNLPVKIIATMSGLSGGVAGPTHQGIEDLGTMRMMPNMTVLAPGDPLLMKQFMRLAYELPGPVYIRLGRGDDPVIYGADVVVEIGKAIQLRDGDALTIIACGSLVTEAFEASKLLEAEGIAVRVLDMHTIKPIDVEAIIKAATETGAILTAEDHSIFAGMGSAVAEVVASEGIGAKVRRLGVPDVFGIVGMPDDLFHHFGLDAEGIVTSAKQLLAEL
jgi:transketolase